MAAPHNGWNLPLRAKRWIDLRSGGGYCLAPPEAIILGVNNVCNLHCVMCDVGTGAGDTNFARALTGALPRNMPIELLRTVVDQAAGFAPEAELGFAFTEPGIYPHLLEGIAFAKSRGLRVSLTTNGSTLGKLAGGLAESGLDELHVSIDGPADVHDRIRGREGSFEAARAGIQSLHSSRPIPTDLYCAVTNENQRHLVEFADAVRDWPLVSVTIMHTNFVTAEMAAAHNARHGGFARGTVSSMAAFDPGRIDTASLSAELLRVTRSGSYHFPVAVQPRLVTAAELETYYHAHTTPVGRRCTDPLRYLMVKSNGEVIAAHGRCYDLRVGSLYEERLSAIWNSARFREFRRLLRQEGGLLPACLRCCGAMSR